MSSDHEFDSILSPELLGPVFKTENVTLRQALYTDNTNRRLRLLATFVPDELIFLIDAQKKFVDHDFAAIILTDISALYDYFDNFCDGDNGGSSNLSRTIYMYTSSIIEKIYYNGGDLLKFIDDGIMSMWRRNENEGEEDVLSRAIACTFSIKEVTQKLHEKYFNTRRALAPVKSAIAAGKLAFTVTGTCDVLRYSITGEPVTAIRAAIKLSKPNDIIITEEAWKRCNPNDYSFAINNQCQIKLTKILKKTSSAKNLECRTNIEYICEPEVERTTSIFNQHRYFQALPLIVNISKSTKRRCIAIVQNQEIEKMIVSNRHKILDACKNPIGISLKRFVNVPVREQIEQDKPLEYLTEMRNITVVLIGVNSKFSTKNRLISLADTCHDFIVKVCEDIGILEDVSLRETHVHFRLVFGLRSYLKNSNHCQFGLSSAWKLFQILNRVANVDDVAIGISTGTSCCTVIGHVARRYYAIIGPQITNAENIMLESSNKITCDLDTLIYSGIRKSHFRSVGLIDMRGSGKGYIYNFAYEDLSKDYATNMRKKSLPMLNRFNELETFSELLDEIGLPNRRYSGILIEADTRMGKSRILDALTAQAKNRQFNLIKIALHESFAVKPYSVIYKILEQIFNAEECQTIDEYERVIARKLCHILQPEDFCYMNKILRVRFKLSKKYIKDSDWNRHHKSVEIFDNIIKLSTRSVKMGFFLDNVHFMDYMSWQFLSHAMNNRNIIFAMTILRPQSWEDLSRVETDICKDKRLLQLSLRGLEQDELITLACQMLNVYGVSSELHDFILSTDGHYPGWFEHFLTLMTIACAIDIVHLSPDEFEKYDIYFPPLKLVTRISPDLLPEQVAPPKPLDQRSKVAVCLTNKNFKIANTFRDYNIRGLASEIFSRLSATEQDILKCATILGKVFIRRILETIVPNEHRYKTSEDIPPNERHLATYSQCEYMEFKNVFFPTYVRETMHDSEIKELHLLAVNIYKKDARRCTACGGGSFIKLPGEDQLLRKSSKSPSQSRKSTDKYLFENQNESNQSKTDDKTEEPDDFRDRMSIRGTSILRTFFETEKSTAFDEGSEFDVDNVKRLMTRKSCKKSSIHPVTCQDINEPLILNKFGHIDFRNCRCLSIIDCVFIRLEQHIVNTDNNDKIIQFMMEYAAALVEFGQPSYALRFLAAIDGRYDFVRTNDTWKNPSQYIKMIRKSVILCLKGNAYMLLGNYPQAKTNFLDAMILFQYDFTYSKTFTYYKTLYERTRQCIRWKFTYPSVSTTIKGRRRMIKKQNIASCLRHVAEILLVNKKYKLAKFASLQSIVFGFDSYCLSSFHDQCRLYLSVVNVYSQLGDLSFLTHVEKYILFAINQVQDWDNSDNVIILTYVYTSIFKVSILRGKLTKAVQFGGKALHLAKAFRLVRLEFGILLLMIQIMMRLKRFCEVMDMMQQFRDNSFEDVDKSALTWYYALCMDLLLDAGIFVEGYESCAAHAKKILSGKSEAFVLRDDRGIKRLLNGLWMWQLRRGDLNSKAFVTSLDYFIVGFEADDYSQIVTLCKILESHLILLTRCINMKKGIEVQEILSDIKSLMDILDEIVKIYECILPHYYLLKAYFNILHGKRLTAFKYLRHADKSATKENNLLVLAWIHHNKTTWEALTYNNMARYWEENIGYKNSIAWQDIDMFGVDDWSNLLYSLPIPDSFL